LNWCMGQAGVEVISSTKDQDVVEMYQREYEYEVFGAEVTKPSEQAFKALMTPRQRGGSVMLFSPPVGRQEKDNIAFMRRHRLIPSVDDQARINEWGLRGNRLHITKTLLERARFWRGIMLPENGTEAGIFIMRLIEAGVIASMVRFGGFIEGHNEIRSDGVEEIWRYLKSYL